MPLPRRQAELFNDGVGRADILPAEDRGFFVFQIFIDVEKMYNFFQDMRRQIRQMLNALKARVGGGDRQNLLVRPFLVAASSGHPEAGRRSGSLGKSAAS